MGITYQKIAMYPAQNGDFGSDAGAALYARSWCRRGLLMVSNWGGAGSILMQLLGEDRASSSDDADH